ncbi:hypothetical protein [Anaerosacchariphilus polymeriproducens]|nr:hypothetical protein [Anaerosacchariphilus polymeriproducens]
MEYIPDNLDAFEEHEQEISRYSRMRKRIKHNEDMEELGEDEE